MNIIAATTFTLAALFSVAAHAQSARPSDSQVEKLIEQTQKSAKDFERALDRDLKSSTVRGAAGEVRVDLFLKDFQGEMERMNERFDSKYAASAELAAVLRRAGNLDAFMESQPPSLKGRSEWDTFAGSLNDLAEAYGSSFPMKAESPPRRMNDLEIEQATDAAVKNGQALRKSLSDVYGKEDKESMKAAEVQIDAMTKAAKGLKARVDDDKPASGEAAVFVAAVAEVQSSLGDRALTANAKTAADGISASLSKVEQAFGMREQAASPAQTAPPAQPQQAAPPAQTAPPAQPQQAAPPAQTAPPEQGAPPAPPAQPEQAAQPEQPQPGQP